MQKKYIFVFIFLLISIYFFVNNRQVSKNNNLVPTPTKYGQDNVLSRQKKQKVQNNNQISKSSIFVPYWADLTEENHSKNYARYIYFGLGVNKTGIIADDSSYTNIDNFIKSFSGQTGEIWLTLRMTNSEDNLAILKDPRVEDKIINETIDILKKYKFKGMVLDLEMSTIAFDDVVSSIDNFVQKMYIPLFKENINFSIALYGDNFYRKRPYNLASIVNNSDEILVMAYDFHKSRGEPGPNFPLSGQEKYGYNMKKMIDDFSQFVPPEKLTIIFGMYGYDWMVDEKKRPIAQGKALTLSEVTHDFVDSCKVENCVLRRDTSSSEQEVSYVEKSGQLHIIWFEDKESVAKKMDYLENRGISNFAYWAWGYF